MEALGRLRSGAKSISAFNPGDEVDFDPTTEDEFGSPDSGASRRATFYEIRAIDRIHAVKLVELRHVHVRAHDIAEAKSRELQCSAEQFHTGPRLVLDTAERDRPRRIRSDLTGEKCKTVDYHDIAVAGGIQSSG